MSAPNDGAAELWLDELQRTGDPDREKQLVKELRREMATLEAWLDRGWTWFQRNAERAGTPEFGRREDRWIERLRLFERVSAAVAS